jgi:hypothetical protein
MGKEHRALVLILHRIDVRDVLDGVAAVLCDAFDQILERISDGIGAGSRIVFIDDAFEIDESVFPDRVHVDDLTVIRSGKPP